MKHYYIAARTTEELKLMKEKLGSGDTNGIVIMSVDMYDGLIPVGKDNAHVCSRFDDTDLKVIPGDSV